MFKIALMALMGLSQSANFYNTVEKVDEQIAIIKKFQDKQVKMWGGKTTGTGADQSDIIPASSYDLQKSTCGECVVNNGKWDQAEKKCMPSGNASPQTIEDFMTEAQACGAQAEFCLAENVPVGANITKFFSTIADQPLWKYRVNHAMIDGDTKEAKYTQYSSICSWKFEIPVAYVGGISFEMVPLPNEITFFYKLGYSDGKAPEYYNQKKFTGMSIVRQDRKVRVDFDINSMEFAFVTTNKNGGYNYQLNGFQMIVQKCTYKGLKTIATIGTWFWDYLLVSAFLCTAIGICYLFKKYCTYWDKKVILPPEYIPSSEEERIKAAKEAELIDGPPKQNTAVNSFFQPNDDCYQRI